MKLFRGKLLGLGAALWAAGLGAQPVITSQPADQSVANGGNITFNVTATGTGPLTYQWQCNGTNIQNNIISTIAGTNIAGFSGDGGAATNARLSTPSGVVADNHGNVLIADTVNSRIRWVDSNGIITTVAGTNSTTFGGDGGPANLAKLSGPYGVAVDAGGNYFIADTGHNRIRKVDTNGIIITVAGTGTAGYGGDGAVATNANLNAPHGVAVDSLGNLYIADTGNNRIRMVDTNGNITTLAGTNSAGITGDGGLAANAKLSSPQGVAVNGAGNIFIADYNSSRIRRIDATGIITTFAGTNVSGFLGDGGAATNARLSAPAGVAVDSYGYVFIADYSNNRIRQVDPNGIITTVAGNGATSFSGDGGAATNAGLFQPSGVGMEPDGSLLIADTTHARIRRATLGRIPALSINGVTTNNAGNYQVIVTGPDGSVTSSVVSLTVGFAPSVVAQPQSLAVSNGLPASLGLVAGGTSPFYYQWYQNNSAVDGGTNASLNYPAAASQQIGNYFCIITNSYGSVTSSIVSLNVLTPPSIVTQPTNQTLIVGSNTTFAVAMAGTGPFTVQWQLNGTNVSPNGPIGVIFGLAGYGGNGNGFSGDGSAAISARLYNPSAVAADNAGNILIVDKGNNRIRKVDTNGIITTFAGNGATGYSGDGGPATNASLWNPSGLAVDSNGNIFVADSSNSRVRKIDTNGYISTVAGSGTSGFSGDGGLAVNAKISPSGVAIDSAGNLYIADGGNYRIRKVDTNGYISTVAGNGLSGNTGDGGLATSAKITPSAVALDGSGNLFISCAYSIRKMDPNGIISTVAGTGTSGYSGDGGYATNAALGSAAGIAVDAFGYLYIADGTSYRIRQVDANGIITTVAGNGASGQSSDFGYATNTTLTTPYGVALDSSGNLLIADTGNNRVRRVITGRDPVLRLNNLSGKDPGNYQAIVTSPYGTVTSSVVSLTVLLPPTITTQPNYIIVVAGGSTNLNVAVSGDGPYGYQWFTSSGRTATAWPVVSGGSVVDSYINDPGMGYVSTPHVYFVGGSGSGAAGTASMFHGEVLHITMRNPGSGYSTAPPTIQIDPPPAINTALPNQTNATLPLLSVTNTGATNYFVVVNNNYGSVTSATVYVSVFLPPQNFSVQNVVTGLQMNLTGSPYYPYVLQTATNLAPPVSWQSVQTNYADTNGNWQFTDTNLTGGQKFYRAMGQ